MDEPCVHCGTTISYLPTRDGREWLHLHPPGTPLPNHLRLCADGSGHVACPAQGGD